MPFVSWTDELSVSNSFIDNDHRKLINLVNELHDAMGQGHGKEILGKILAELINYTQEHFKREEEHMRKIGYPDYAIHKIEHDKLLKEVKELEEKFKAGNTMLSVKVSSFLRDWLVNHIMKSDKNLAIAIRRAAA
jgi:hemerythrin-like metal-binding protein